MSTLLFRRPKFCTKKILYSVLLSTMIFMNVFIIMTDYILLFCNDRVIKRLVSLITSSAIIEVEREAALKQAVSASRAAESLMQEDKGTSDLEKKLEEKEAELQTALADVTSMKAQSLSLTKEYDRLMEEKDKVELRLRVLDTTGADGDKKDD